MLTLFAHCPTTITRRRKFPSSQVKGGGEWEKHLQENGNSLRSIIMELDQLSEEEVP
jgi:hypothetical protein